MLSVKLKNCRECATVPKLLSSINCELAKMANNLYLNIGYMLDKPVDATKMSTLLHYKRILTYKQCNEDWASDYSVEKMASRVNFLTANCECCDNDRTVYTTTTSTTADPQATTTTTTTILGTTTTTTTLISLTLFNVGSTDQVRCSVIAETENFPLYHNGSGEFPDVGDIVYLDSLGQVPFVSPDNTSRYMNGLELATDSNGERILVTCN